MRVDCLDTGYVELVQHMGNDDFICEAARVSTNSSSKDNKRLIDYLIRHRHTSPFEFVKFVFKVHIPIFIDRQLVRHRMTNRNEVSGRYTEIKDEFFMPTTWRQQGGRNKQCSGEAFDYSPSLLFDRKPKCSAEELAFEEYFSRLASGVSRELARTCLPLSTYTTYYWGIDLHNLLHFLKLRLHKDAQPEIIEYAKAFLTLITPIVPLTVDSWRNHVLNAVTFSEDELEYLLIDEAALQDIHLQESRLHEFGEKTEYIKSGISIDD